MENERILIVESGDSSFRGYTLQSLLENNIKIVLLKESMPTWEMDYIEDYIIVDFSKVDKLIATIKEYNANKKIDGIFTYIELFVELTAKISKALDLNFYSEKVASTVRNKYMMRSCFNQYGLIVPKYDKYEGCLKSVVEKIGIPCVVKPIAGYSSINVIKIENEEEIPEVENIIKCTRSSEEWHIEDEYIIEEYVDGIEISVESIVVNDNIFHITITDKFKGKEPYFEEIGQTVPSCLSSETVMSLYEATSKGIKALGLKNCAVHTEIKLSKRGPVIIEMGGRLAGDKIPYLAKCALGVDMSMGAAMASVGKVYDLSNKSSNYASLAFFVPVKKQTVHAIPTTNPPIEGIVEFEFWSTVGEEVAPPPEQFFSRLGFVLATADTYEKSRDRVLKTIEWLSELTGIEFAF